MARKKRGPAQGGAVRAHADAVATAAQAPSEGSAERPVVQDEERQSPPAGPGTPDAGDVGDSGVPVDRGDAEGPVAQGGDGSSPEESPGSGETPDAACEVAASEVPVSEAATESPILGEQDEPRAGRAEVPASGEAPCVVLTTDDAGEDECREGLDGSPELPEPPMHDPPVTGSPEVGAAPDATRPVAKDARVAGDVAREARSAGHEEAASTPSGAAGTAVPVPPVVAPGPEEVRPGAGGQEDVPAAGVPRARTPEPAAAVTLPAAAERTAPATDTPEVLGSAERDRAGEPAREGRVPVPDVAGTPRGAARLSRARPRVTWGQLVGGVLCGALGFALVTQARSTQEQGLSSLRQTDLVRILSGLTDEATRLEQEAGALQATYDELRSGSGSSEAAVTAARERLEVLGILTGVTRATGPGIELVITDPHGSTDAADLLNTLQELRDAGAEAVQIGDIRVVASTAFENGNEAGDTGSEGVRVDGKLLRSPYVFRVIGDPQTLASALEIPGGALEVIRGRGGKGHVTQSASIEVNAVRSVPTARFATPAPPGAKP